MGKGGRVTWTGSQGLPKAPRERVLTLPPNIAHIIATCLSAYCVLTTMSGGRAWKHLLYRDEEAEAQSRDRTCLRTHSS